MQTHGRSINYYGVRVELYRHKMSYYCTAFIQVQHLVRETQQTEK